MKIARILLISTFSCLMIAFIYFFTSGEDYNNVLLSTLLSSIFIISELYKNMSIQFSDKRMICLLLSSTLYFFQIFFTIIETPIFSIIALIIGLMIILNYLYWNTIAALKGARKKKK